MKLKVILTFAIVLILAGITLYFGYKFDQQSQDYGADDSSALFGGIAESGYLSAGYVITETENGIKTCGFSVINSSQAVTAAHCVDNALSMSLGKGTYTSTRSDDVSIYRAVQKEGWVKYQKRTDDLAVLYYDDSTFFDEFSTIAAPIEGCNYRVIAYGRTQDPADPPMLRKSAKLCAYDIEDNIFKIKGTGDSGICFGDSGSPLYIEGTNELVGLVVSIIDTEDKNTPCAFSNTAIVIRADANLDLIKGELPVTSGTSASDIAIPKEFTVDVANETFLEKIGLAKWSNLDKNTKYSYLLYSAGGMFFVMFMILLYRLIKSSNTQAKDQVFLKSKSGII